MTVALKGGRTENKTPSLTPEVFFVGIPISANSAGAHHNPPIWGKLIGVETRQPTDSGKNRTKIFNIGTTEEDTIKPATCSWSIRLHTTETSDLLGSEVDLLGRPSPLPLPAPSTLFLNHGNQSLISTQAGKGGNHSRNMLGFAQLHHSYRNPRGLQSTFCLTNRNGGARQSIHGITNTDGLIIVDHGSRRKESNLMLNEFVAMFVEKTGYPIVEPAHMELAEPSIQDAFRLCVQQGANRVIVSPFFLFPGRHWHQDIPSLTAEAAKDYPGVSYMITAPLGLHPLLVDVVDDRIKHCLSHVAGDADECSVCAGTGKCHLY
ncbi:hypothetical protein R6Q57_012086 [Mikania cordata]